MKKPKVETFRAWAAVDDDGGVPVAHGACAIYYPRRPCDHDETSYVRVVVRDARDDSEARLKRENARLRRAMRRALGLLHRSAWESNRDMARGVLDAALERRDRR